MPKIEIYTKDYCPYCHRAKALLEKKGITYKEYDVTRDRALELEMRARSNGFTVPQIIINGTPIGGSDDLIKLDSQERLNQLLGQCNAA